MNLVTRKTTTLVENIHPMPQNAFTVQIPIIESKEQDLRQLLAVVNDNSADNAILSFSVFNNLHFARILLLEGPDHIKTYASSLLLMANVDGSIADFIEQLVQENSPGLDVMLDMCQGYPTGKERSAQSRKKFLNDHQLPSQAFYINTVGRNSQQIKLESELHDGLQYFLNGLAPGDFDSAQGLRNAVIDFVGKRPELAWALASRARPSRLWQSLENLRFAGLVALGVLIVAWGWPLLMGWILTLRKREFSDDQDEHRPSLNRLNTLRASEDIAAHNPFSAVGYLKPGWIRRMTVRALLATAQVTLRHVFNRGDLAGVPQLGLDGVDTIHFARWTLLDNDRRLLFTSNYDGSLESYMVDFIDKVAWGLNLIFSNGAGYPLTRWLVHEGARNEQRFKDYIGNHQLQNQVWFTNYPHLTAVNIANNEAIRDGLSGPMNEHQASVWLKRL